MRHNVKEAIRQNLSRLELSNLILLWTPLAVSQFIAHAELPIVNAGVAHGFSQELSLASLNVAISITIAVESWVDMLLPTSTALSNTIQSFKMIRRFTLLLAVLLTIFMLLLSSTPVFDWLVIRIMEIPMEVAHETKPALQILTLWPAAIAWRRLYQGVLIRLGRTRLIAGATVIRISISGLVSFIGVQIIHVPAVIIGSVGLIAAVTVEAIIIFFFTSKIMKQDLSWVDAEGQPTSLELARLLRFYVPLAITSFLSYLLLPLLNSGIGRAFHPIDSLATWPVVFSLVHTLDALGYPLQETVVAASRTGKPLSAMRTLTLIVGFGAMIIASVVAFTSIGSFYFHIFSSLPQDLSQLAIKGMSLMVAIPLLISVQSLLRGRLAVLNKTFLVQVGAMVNLVLLSICLALGIINGAILGLYVAAIAYNIGLIGELIFLMVSFPFIQHRQIKNPLSYLKTLL